MHCYIFSSYQVVIWMALVFMVLLVSFFSEFAVCIQWTVHLFMVSIEIHIAFWLLLIVELSVLLYHLVITIILDALINQYPIFQQLFSFTDFVGIPDGINYHILQLNKSMLYIMHILILDLPNIKHNVFGSLHSKYLWQGHKMPCWQHCLYVS